MALALELILTLDLFRKDKFASAVARGCFQLSTEAVTFGQEAEKKHYHGLRVLSCRRLGNTLSVRPSYYCVAFVFTFLVSFLTVLFSYPLFPVHVVVLTFSLLSYV